MTNQERELILRRRRAYKKRMERRKNFFTTVLVLLFITAATVIYFTSGLKQSDFIWEKQSVTEDAPTLWEIAEDLNLNEDIREIVFLIEQRNNLKNAYIQLHDVIEVPIKHKK